MTPAYRSGYCPSIRHKLTITIRAPVAEELPGVAHFADQIQIKIGNDDRVFVARRLGNDLAARIAKVALAIKFADVPGHLVTDAIDRAHKVTVRDRMCRLFQLPKIFGKSGNGG